MIGSQRTILEFVQSSCCTLDRFRIYLRLVRFAHGEFCNFVLHVFLFVNSAVRCMYVHSTYCLYYWTWRFEYVFQQLNTRTTTSEYVVVRSKRPLSVFLVKLMVRPLLVQFCGEMVVQSAWYFIWYHISGRDFWLKSPIPEVSALDISALFFTINLFDIFAGETPVAYFITESMSSVQQKGLLYTVDTKDRRSCLSKRGSRSVAGEFDANQSWLSH